MSAAGGELPLIEPANRAEWRAWLEQHHATSPGVWVAVGKKGGTRTTLTYEELVLEALRFGWIDGVVNRLDADRFKQRLTPRRPGGTWSPSNKQRVARLMEQGLMTPAGIAAIEAAHVSGSWELLDDVEALVVPEDLAAALGAVPEAAVFFSELAPSSKKYILYWIGSAKRNETRARRIAETVQAAAEGRLPGALGAAGG